MNVADSEVVAAILQDRSYEPVETADGADAIFLNTCSVRDNAEQRIWGRLDYFKSLKKKNKNLIVGVLGCMAERVGDELLAHPCRRFGGRTRCLPRSAFPDRQSAKRNRSHQR